LGYRDVRRGPDRRSRGLTLRVWAISPRAGYAGPARTLCALARGQPRTGAATGSGGLDHDGQSGSPK